MSRPMRPSPPRTARFDWGPVVKQRDRKLSLNVARDAATALLNCWIRDSDTDYPTIEGRPGFAPADDSMGNVAVQWIGQLSKSNGTEISAVIAGGEIWTYNWTNGTLGKVVDASDLTTATITLDASARVRACEFQDGLTFSDGLNQPFHWDGTSGDSGLTPISNGPSVAFGRPFVHYAKQWFIKDSERSTPVWSEEGDVNTGYEASGYTNAWTLRQTAQEGFSAAASTNDGLVLFRANSTTLITGEVTPNFASTGNDEAISEVVGSVSPDAVLNMGGVIYFLSNDRRLMRLEGRSLIDVGKGARARLAALNHLQLSRAFLEYMDFAEQGERLILGVPEIGRDHCNVYVVVNPATGLCEGTWTGWVSTALGRWKNAQGEWRLVHGGGDTAATIDKGYVYIHDVPDGSAMNDEWPAGASPIPTQVETSYLGESSELEKAWLEGTLLLASSFSTTNISTTLVTPRGEHALATPLSYNGDAGGFILDVSQLDVDAFGSDGGGEARLTFGTRGVHGRWAMVRMSHATLNERFAVQRLTLTAAAAERRPSVR